MPRFTRDEADALLPKVAPYVEDLVRRKQAFDRRPTEPLAAEIRAIVRTINEMGIEVKDLGQGLIDFPAQRRGRAIYLCWKLGEGDKVGWWHPVEGGFAGRRPIRDLFDN